jgi:hypothetical protein
MDRVPEVPSEDVEARAEELLPEEQVAGSDDPKPRPKRS